VRCRGRGYGAFKFAPDWVFIKFALEGLGLSQCQRVAPFLLSATSAFCFFRDAYKITTKEVGFQQHTDFASWASENISRRCVNGTTGSLTKKINVYIFVS
jgi:hypothetical protein